MQTVEFLITSKDTKHAYSLVFQVENNIVKRCKCYVKPTGKMCAFQEYIPESINVGKHELIIELDKRKFSLILVNHKWRIVEIAEN